MKPRERYLQTLLFGRPDRVPLAPGGPRESTLKAWHEQGLPENIDHRDALSQILGVPREALDTTVGLPTFFRMIPIFEEKVLEHKDGHYIVQDWMGAITEISDTYDYTYIRSAKDFVTRKWHRFPVQNRTDWEQMTRRYKANDAERFTPELMAQCREAERSDRAVVLAVNGPFWQIREWVGMENLCLMMMDDPGLVVEMAAFWQQFTLEVMKNVLRQVHVDALHMSEDMAYKAHSMISPAMARRFLQPTYCSWSELCRSYGVSVLDMDSDGEISQLIPIWIESGFNCCDPIEVAAENDIVQYRRRFGQRMAYTGGIDKRAIAAGGAMMRAEVERVIMPLFTDGGYLPGCDHGVPPDISWPNFVEYSRLLAQRCGWR